MSSLESQTHQMLLNPSLHPAVPPRGLYHSLKEQLPADPGARKTPDGW